MVALGYHLSSEEHGPQDLVRYAVRAEEVGFGFALISDHFHPWTPRQGHSPFVWAVLGAIAQATRRLRVGTGVTAPTIRLHPAIVAHAAATASLLMPGRFFLGLGAGERLNEHVLGDPWPPPRVRVDMLEEALQVIRALWEGGSKNHRGRHYTVEDARIFDLPDPPPPIVVAAAGKRTTRIAADLGDGLLSVVPDAELVRRFRDHAGADRPAYAKMTACWAPDEAEARRIAHEAWPVGGLPGRLMPELRVPEDFEAATSVLDEGQVAAGLVVGPDAGAHVRAVEQFVEAGFDHVAVHQVGPHQEGFFDFYGREVIPRLTQYQAGDPPTEGKESHADDHRT
ncbi:MAG: TIGR03557 family F420-dependent LLM class oxidoreductase [Actinomycetota bacterium]|nr:TIGR03557 family F420-dependent LLM class oxidoreductase [Actinomycetota bacterium]